MLSYAKVKSKPRILQSLTGMSLAEFEALVPSFEKAWQDYIYKHFIEASERKREYGGGRKAELQESRDKMLFILFYFRQYPTQEVQGFLFGIGQPQANLWVDILRLVFGAMVCPANIGERAGAMRLLESLKYPLSRLQKILVDKGFSGEDITQWVKDNFDCIWEVSTRAEEQEGFVVESKRWVVERNFAWIGKYRRLSKDYEFYENTSESSIYIALIRKMLRDLTAVNS